MNGDQSETRAGDCSHFNWHSYYHQSLDLSIYLYIQDWHYLPAVHYICCCYEIEIKNGDIINTPCHNESDPLAAVKRRWKSPRPAIDHLTKTRAPYVPALMLIMQVDGCMYWLISGLYAGSQAILTHFKKTSRNYIGHFYTQDLLNPMPTSNAISVAIAQQKLRVWRLGWWMACLTFIQDSTFTPHYRHALTLTFFLLTITLTFLQPNLNHALVI